MGKPRPFDTTLRLVERAQEGDTKALGRLLELHTPRLRTLILLRLGPELRTRVEPDDILQETYLRALQAIRSFSWRGRDSFVRWLSGICEHVIKDQHRYHFGAEKRNPRKEVRLKIRELSASLPTPSREARRAERFERLEQALAQLEPHYREVIILARVRCLPIKEIARRLGKTPDAVSQLLLRALRKLAMYFGPTESLSLPARTLDPDPVPTDASGCENNQQLKRMDRWGRKEERGA